MRKYYQKDLLKSFFLDNKDYIFVFILFLVLIFLFCTSFSMYHFSCDRSLGVCNFSLISDSKYQEVDFPIDSIKDISVKQSRHVSFVVINLDKFNVDGDNQLIISFDSIFVSDNFVKKLNNLKYGYAKEFKYDYIPYFYIFSFWFILLLPFVFFRYKGSLIVLLSSTFLLASLFYYIFITNCASIITFLNKFVFAHMF